MGFYYFALVVGIIATIVFIAIMCVNGEQLNDMEQGFVFLMAILAMVCWGAFFYGVGDRHGAIETAKGHYKTYYLYDKDGNVSDTIAEFFH